MSELLPSDEPAQSLKTQTTLDVDVDNVAAAKPWTERWVDFEPSPIVAHRVRVVQIVPQPATEQPSALMISARDVLVLAFTVLILTLGTIGILYRHEWYRYNL